MHLNSPYGYPRFASQKAFNAAYQSQNEASYDRTLEKAHKLKRKLGGKAGLDMPLPPKPKGMHSKTYQKMCASIEGYERRGWVEAAIRLGIRV